MAASATPAALTAALASRDPVTRINAAVGVFNQYVAAAVCVWRVTRGARRCEDASQVRVAPPP